MPRPCLHARLRGSALSVYPAMEGGLYGGETCVELGRSSVLDGGGASHVKRKLRKPRKTVGDDGDDGDDASCAQCLRLRHYLTILVIRCIRTFE